MLTRSKTKSISLSVLKNKTSNTKVKPSPYNYNDFADLTKIRNNQRIVESVKMFLGTSSERKALIFDGINGYTTSVLLKNNINNITIIEKDVKTAMKLATMYPHVNVKNNILSEIIKNEHKTVSSPNIFYLDYMSTAYGNSQVRPMDDLQKLLKINNNTTIILALTFSLRSNHKSYCNETRSVTFHKEITQGIFRDSKYSIMYSEKPKVYQRKLDNGKRGTPMAFYLYVLELKILEPIWTVVKKNGTVITEFFGEPL